jgi:glycosyltransferase involved in cell wall biosynthesis
MWTPPLPVSSRRAGAAWLQDFERRHGRPLRVLHIGNIANNGYINAKIQRKVGIEADVCCYEYYHVMGCPEWEDSDFEGDPGDLSFPDWWAVDLKGFKRPEWFAQGRQRTCHRYLRALNRGDERRARILKCKLNIERWLRCRSTLRAKVAAAVLGVPNGSNPARPELPARREPARKSEIGEWITASAAWLAELVYFVIRWVGWRTRVSFLRRAGIASSYMWSAIRTTLRKLVILCIASAAVARGQGWRTAALMLFPRRLEQVARTDEHRARVANAAARSGTTNPFLSAASSFPTRLEETYLGLFGPSRKPITTEDFGPLVAGIPHWQALFEGYDIVQGYSLDAMWPMLSGLSHYAAYEHGTLRDLPFEDSPRGRLCALSFRLAQVVFVTNSDVVPAARRLGLTDEQMVFLPHAVDSDRLVSFRRTHGHLRPRSGDDIVLISPTRHDWVDSDPLWAKGNDLLIRGLGQARQAGAPVRLVLFEWGRHVNESKGLVEELGLQQYVTWSPTLKKQALWIEYMKAHAIVDQFCTPAMGSVAFESLALGCRVVTALDRPTIEEFFGSMPPVLNSATVEEVADAIRRVTSDPCDDAGIGDAAARWFEENHSTERIIELEIRAYERLLHLKEMQEGYHSTGDF